MVLSSSRVPRSDFSLYILLRSLKHDDHRSCFFFSALFTGMDEKDVCSFIQRQPSSHFELEDGSPNRACVDVIHQVVTSRTTITWTSLVTLFLVYGVPSLFRLTMFIWSYNRNEIEKQELREKNKEIAAKKKLTEDSNRLGKDLLIQMTTVLGMNDNNGQVKIVQMRGIIDDIYNESHQYKHYERLIKTLRWKPPSGGWLIRNSKNAIMVCIENELLNRSCSESEEDDV